MGFPDGRAGDQVRFAHGARRVGVVFLLRTVSNVAGRHRRRHHHRVRDR